MSAKLVWITPKAYDLVEYIARVSSPTNQQKMDRGELSSGKLIKYLIDHNHWSPFEMVSACVEINTTRDIGRQILRHRSFSFQEFSQRYSEVSSDYVPREMRLKGITNRQGSLEEKDSCSEILALAQANSAFDCYQDLLARGVAPECARAVLPEGMTPTRMYMSGTMRSWIHYLQIRLDEHTQKEHRYIAEGIRDCFLGKDARWTEILGKKN